LWRPYPFAGGANHIGIESRLTAANPGTSDPRARRRILARLRRTGRLAGRARPGDGAPRRLLPADTL